VVRITKPPAVRRAELLDTAERLFFERGYEPTSVNDIIVAAGVSKGAFYHYFPSKEAVLEAVADRMAVQSIARASEVLEDPALDALGRLNAFFSSSRAFKVEYAPMIVGSLGVMLRPENLPLRHRINTATIARVAPILARIIAQGVEQGIFDTPDPLGTAELLLHLGTGVHDAIGNAVEQAKRGDIEAAANTIERRLELFQTAFNRILRLPDDAVRIVEPGFARAVFATIKSA
jgi:AcrR family transcriptional regulator